MSSLLHASDPTLCDRVVRAARSRNGGHGSSLTSFIRGALPAILSLRRSGYTWSAISVALKEAEPTRFHGEPIDPQTLRRITSRLRAAADPRNAQVVRPSAVQGLRTQGHNGDGHNGDGHNGDGHNGDGHNGDGHNGEVFGPLPGETGGAFRELEPISSGDGPSDGPIQNSDSVDSSSATHRRGLESLVG